MVKMSELVKIVNDLVKIVREGFKIVREGFKIVRKGFKIVRKGLKIVLEKIPFWAHPRFFHRGAPDIRNLALCDIRQK